MQGCIEGVDLLYSAHWSNIQSKPLLLHLPQLILGNWHTSISSLEIVITAQRIAQNNSRQSFGFDHVEPILEDIVKNGRHLRSFCLSFLIAS